MNAAVGPGVDSSGANADVSAPDTGQAALQPTPPSAPDRIPNPWKRQAPPSQPNGRQIIYHTVVPGDTLYSLARKYRVSVQQLIDWNHLSGTTIRAGQRLIVNASAP